MSSVLALNPAPLAVTAPFTVTRELVSALMPVPKPWAVTAAFVVTFALFVALTVGACEQRRGNV